MDDTTIDELIEEHHAQRVLMSLLLQSQSGSELRQSLFRRLKVSVERHHSIEEEELHPVLANLLGAKFQADDEHRQLEDMLEAVACTPLDSPEWMTRAEKFVERNCYHLNEEDNVLFPAIRTMRERRALAESRATGEGMMRHSLRTEHNVDEPSLS